MNVIDTNVLIYASDQRDPLRRGIARHVIEISPEAVMPWQVACEYMAASRKLIPQGVTPADAWRSLNRLLEMMPLLVPTRTMLESARALHTQQQRSFWDALILAACIEAGATRLYSEDISPNPPIDGLEIVNPFA